MTEQTIHIDMSATNRQCGSCTLCCRLLPVAELGKKANTRCEHQRASCGCSIYDKRPKSCQQWSCRWLTDPRTTELRRPDRSHYVIDQMPDQVRCKDDGRETKMMVLQVWIDPNYPDAWRDPALGAYVEQLALKEGLGCILRYGNEAGRALFAPCFMADGKWFLGEPTPSDPTIGMYSLLPDDQKPPR